MRNVNQIINRPELIPMELTRMKCCLNAEWKVTTFQRKMNMRISEELGMKIINHMWERLEYGLFTD